MLDELEVDIDEEEFINEIDSVDMDANTPITEEDFRLVELERLIF